jgi:carbamate kinase
MNKLDAAISTVEAILKTKAARELAEGADYSEFVLMTRNDIACIKFLAEEAQRLSKRNSLLEDLIKRYEED